MKDLLEETNLFRALEKDIVASGFVGDTTIPQLVWLASHTRHFDVPVSLVIFGPSGSGKSFALKTALKFIPEDAFELFHGMSEKAIIYSVDLDLCHKHLIIQEAAGMAEGHGRTYIRQLLSEGEVRYRTVENRDGSLDAKELYISGPTGLMMTTTASGLHPEDASRVLCINIAEDSDHIRQILMSQALGIRPSLPEGRLEAWKELSRSVTLSERQVSIPFAEKLALSLPTSHFRVQRDFTQVLSLVKASALLHSCHRGTDEDGKVIASMEDYEDVYRLVAKPLAEGLETSVPSSVREVIGAVETLTERIRGGLRVSEMRITQRKIAELTSRDRSIVSRNVKKAIEAGYLEDANPGQGKEADLHLGSRKLEENIQVLPSPEALIRVFEDNSAV